jgi:hypothetical protein
VGGEVDAPGQRRRGNHHLDLAEGVELLHRLTIPLNQAWGRTESIVCND